MIESGALLGPYRVRGPIGAGGMGEVYQADSLDGGALRGFKALARDHGWR